MRQKKRNTKKERNFCRLPSALVVDDATSKRFARGRQPALSNVHGSAGQDQRLDYTRLGDNSPLASVSGHAAKLDSSSQGCQEFLRQIWTSYCVCWVVSQEGVVSSLQTEVGVRLFFEFEEFSSNSKIRFEFEEIFRIRTICSVRRTFFEVEQIYLNSKNFLRVRRMFFEFEENHWLLGVRRELSSNSKNVFRTRRTFFDLKSKASNSKTCIQIWRKSFEVGQHFSSSKGILGSQTDTSSKKIIRVGSNIVEFEEKSEF